MGRESVYLLWGIEVLIMFIVLWCGAKDFSVLCRQIHEWWTLEWERAIGKEVMMPMELELA